LEGIEEEAQVNVIESISVNGTQFEIDDYKNVDLNIIQTDSLIFKIPTTNSTDIIFFNIEFTSDESFERIDKVINTFDNSTYSINDNGFIENLQLFTGLKLIGLSTNGIEPPFQKEQLIVKLDSLCKDYPLFRFQWIIKDSSDNVTYGPFGFGKISGLQQIFDDYQNDSSNNSGGGTVVTSPVQIPVVEELTSLTITPEHNKIYSHTLEEDDTFVFSHSRVNEAVIFKLYLTMPSSPVSFKFPANIVWNKTPDFTVGNALYMVEFEWNPFLSKWMGKQVWDPINL
jgi:hypothetical protein